MSVERGGCRKGESAVKGRLQERGGCRKGEAAGKERVLLLRTSNV
jgi:hypothetical protein